MEKCMVHIIFIYARAKGNYQWFLFGCFLDLKVRGSPFHLANDSVDGFLYKNHDKPQV